MKCLVILGPGRSVKTTLAKMAARAHGANLIHADCLISAFESALPDVGINWERLDTRDKLAAYLAAYVSGMMNLGNLVIEGASINLESCDRFFTGDDFKIVATGFPNATASEMIREIRAHDTDSELSYYLTDEQLAGWLNKNIEYSQRLFAECKARGIEALDTGKYRAKILEKFVNELSFSPYVGISDNAKADAKSYAEQHFTKNHTLN